MSKTQFITLLGEAKLAPRDKTAAGSLEFVQELDRLAEELPEGSRAALYHAVESLAHYVSKEAARAAFDVSLGVFPDDSQRKALIEHLQQKGNQYPLTNTRMGEVVRAYRGG